jgi:hypothetical protein
VGRKASQSNAEADRAQAAAACVRGHLAHQSQEKTIEEMKRLIGRRR